MKGLTYQQKKESDLDRAMLEILLNGGEKTVYEVCNIINRNFFPLRYATCYRHADKLKEAGCLTERPKPWETVGPHPNKLVRVTQVGIEKLEELEISAAKYKTPNFLKKLQKEVKSIRDGLAEYLAAQELSAEHNVPLSHIMIALNSVPRENPPIKSFKGMKNVPEKTPNASTNAKLVAFLGEAAKSVEENVKLMKPFD